MGNEPITGLSAFYCLSDMWRLAGLLLNLLILNIYIY